MKHRDTKFVILFGDVGVKGDDDDDRNDDDDDDDDGTVSMGVMVYCLFNLKHIDRSM